MNKDNSGCMMMYLKVPGWDLISSIINPKDLHDQGIDKEPHISIAYGIKHKELSLSELVEDTTYLDRGTFKIRLHNLSLFNRPEYDVLKFDVDDSLKVFSELNRFYRSNYEVYPSEFPNYHPHVTLAYLKVGEGSKYIDKIKEVYCESKYFVYGYPNRNKLIIK